MYLVGGLSEQHLFQEQKQIKENKIRVWQQMKRKSLGYYQ